MSTFACRMRRRLVGAALVMAGLLVAWGGAWPARGDGPAAMVLDYDQITLFGAAQTVNGAQELQDLIGFGLDQVIQSSGRYLVTPASDQFPASNAARPTDWALYQ